MTEIAQPMAEPLNSPEPKPAGTHKPWLKRHWKPVFAAAAVVAAVGGGAAGWMLTRPKPAAPAAVVAPTPTPSTPTPTPSPVTKASPLTGVQVSPAQAALPIVSIVVENHPDARPQSGLQSAGVVYETLAEGGITRFQTFFLDDKPAKIGPVRSLRPYFVDWGLEFAAPVAHAGGSATALDLAAQTGLHSLNALVIGAPTFFRTSDRVAPHNLYTSGDLITALLSKRGLSQPATFTASPRKADQPSATAPHPKIRIDFSSASYLVDYTYDPAANDYARALGGKPHTDRNSGKQIHVKNVVVIKTDISVADSAGHMNIRTTGKGQGWVFRDGDVVPVTWSKDSRTARLKLLDASGADVPLDAGNTWYEVMPATKTLSF